MKPCETNNKVVILRFGERCNSAKGTRKSKRAMSDVTFVASDSTASCDRLYSDYSYS